MSIVIILLALFLLIITGICSMFNLIKDNDIVSINKEIVAMKVNNVRKYSDDDFSMMIMPDGGIISGLISGDDVYEVEFVHNNHVDKLKNDAVYEYCKDKIGETVYLDVEEYELRNGIYEHKIIGVAVSED